MRAAIFEILGINQCRKEAFRWTNCSFIGSCRRTRTAPSSQLERRKRFKIALVPCFPWPVSKEGTKSPRPFLFSFEVTVMMIAGKVWQVFRQLGRCKGIWSFMRVRFLARDLRCFKQGSSRNARGGLRVTGQELWNSSFGQVIQARESKDLPAEKPYLLAVAGKSTVQSFPACCWEETEVIWVPREACCVQQTSGRR